MMAAVEREWNPQHMAFKLLNVKPDGATVCHFLLDGHVL
jgi:hypothetical protein